MRSLFQNGRHRGETLCMGEISLNQNTRMSSTGETTIEKNVLGVPFIDGATSPKVSCQPSLAVSGER